MVRLEDVRVGMRVRVIGGPRHLRREGCVVGFDHQSRLPVLVRLDGWATSLHYAPEEIEPAEEVASGGA